MSESYSRMGRFGHHQQGEVVDEAIATFFKFWKDGRPALLNINTHDGRAWINFSGCLGFLSEQNARSTFRACSRSKNSPSPSKIKRNKKRAEDFREKKRREATNFSQTNSSNPDTFQNLSPNNILADVSEIVQPSELSLNKSNFLRSASNNNEILEDQNQQVSSTPSKQLSSTNNMAIPVMERGNKENNFSDSFQDAPVAKVIEVHNPNHKSMIGAKQLDDFLDRTKKEFDDKMNPVVNSLNLSFLCILTLPQ